jgi:hypothetical protein
MILDRALGILARVHTRDNRLCGFTVEMGAVPQPHHGVLNSEYVEAWEAVRMHLHLDVNPEPQPTDSST